MSSPVTCGNAVSPRATPAYRTLAGEARYSTTTLSPAAAGRALPSLTVALAYVRACEGDAVEWEQRWPETDAWRAPDAVDGVSDSAF
jgi:hypothetical protein